MGVVVGPEEAWGSSQGPRKYSMRPVIRTFSRHDAAKKPDAVHDTNWQTTNEQTTS
jgi:hypothetical protein